jgi:hypothetical protein
MANAVALRFGDVNAGGSDTTQLFLKVFGGEVLTAFEENTVVMDKHFVRSISSGKSAQFPMTWKLTAGYHTVGAELDGQAGNTNERVITIDDLLVADVFMANVDEAMTHFDVRSVYSTEAGRALAKKFDQNVLQCMVLAARASAPITGANGGTELTSATTLYKTSASDLAAGLFLAAETMDGNDIPSEGRNAFMKPAQYYLLAQSVNLINKDWGGMGSYADGKILKIADINIVKANHLPTTDISTGPTKYRGDFTKTAAVVATSYAAGTVKLLDLAVESEYDIRRQGTLIVAKYLVGHDYLRPDCAVELKTTS